MRVVTNLYVTFYYPGLIVADTSTKKVGSTDPNLVEWPENAYSFQMYQREDVVEGDKVYKGEPKAIGKMCYHPDSSVESLASVRKNRPNERTLIANMEGNHWGHIIWSRWGNWPQPFDPNESVVLPKQKWQS